LSQAKQFSSVHVKIGDERGHLLSEAKLKRLTECKDLTELVSELGETVYSDKLSKSTTPITSRKLERVFRENLIETQIKITKNSPEFSARFLRMMFINRFEYENIKNTLKAVNNGLLSGEILNRVYMLIEDFLHNRKIFEEAFEAINVKSVVDIFTKTVYGPPLSIGLVKYEETGSTKFFDFMLDKTFYENAAEAFENLPKNEQRNARFYVSMETDGFTILTILRGKILKYDSSSLRIIIPRKHFELSERLVEETLSAENFESALNLFMKTPYAQFLVRTETPGRTLELFEKSQRKAVLEHARKNRIQETFSIGAPIGFMIEKSVETRNLIALSIGIEYGWKPENLLENLLLSV
jgi:vacuolar-type H+-ATPase subunit C/Vma6